MSRRDKRDRAGGTAKHPQGVRRIRKAAKPPTAAQPVTEGFRPHVPSLPPGEGAPVGTLGRMRGTPKGWEPLRQNEHSLPHSRGKVPPQGADEGGYHGCDGHRTGGWGHPPLRRVTIDFVGAAVPSGPSITGAPPWSPSSVMGLRPCHLLPCGAKALAVLSEMLKCRWPSPHPSRLTPCHLPPGEGFPQKTRPRPVFRTRNAGRGFMIYGKRIAASGRCPSSQ